MEIIKAILLGIIQGITEWLPISSTGHMILADEWIQLSGGKEFVDLFMVVVQFGSILAVLVLYFHKLNPFSTQKNQKQKRDTLSLWGKVLIATVPAGIIGLLFEEKINALFYNPTTVAITLIVYGVGFIVVESQKRKGRIRSFAQMSARTAALIGVFQVLALIPGTSRSGATILGATLLGTSRLHPYGSGRIFVFPGDSCHAGRQRIKADQICRPIGGPTAFDIVGGHGGGLCGFAVCHPVFDEIHSDAYL